MTKRNTTLIRVYKKDLADVKLKFPDVTMPNFFHMTVRTNPFVQAEALLRGKKKK